MPVLASSQQEFSDADWRAVSSGDQSKKLKFLLSGISANTTRVLTMPDADVTISAFVATLLDDADAAAVLADLGYAIGTWTPTIKFGGSSTGITYGERIGTYGEFASLVVVSCRVVLTNKGSSTGTFSMTGLPFTGNASGFTAIVDSGGGTLTGLTAGLMLLGAGNSTSIFGRALNSSGTSGTASITNANFTNTSQIVFSAVYLKQ